MPGGDARHFNLAKVEVYHGEGQGDRRVAHHRERAPAHLPPKEPHRLRLLPEKATPPHGVVDGGERRGGHPAGRNGERPAGIRILKAVA